MRLLSAILYLWGDYMSAEKLTQVEAQNLLEMIKRSLIESIDFPSRGKTKEFDVVGDTKKDVFSINIFRAKIHPFKYNFGARIKKNGIMLLELHISQSLVHRNPGGEKIVGSHWHIYSEEYGRNFAFPAEDIHSDLFVENAIMFLNKFNVIEKPQIIYQIEML